MLRSVASLTTFTRGTRLKLPFSNSMKIQKFARRLESKSSLFFISCVRVQGKGVHTQYVHTQRARTKRVYNATMTGLPLSHRQAIQETACLRHYSMSVGSLAGLQGSLGNIQPLRITGSSI